MAQLKIVKVKVRPGQTLQFPGICVHCAQPATEQWELKKRDGRMTRLIDVPLCADCAQTVRRRSGEEERRQKLGWLATGVAALLVTAVSLLFTPAQLAVALRLLLAVLIAGAVATAVYKWSRYWAFQATLPEKKAIYASAAISEFSWRATTFTFTNETFTGRFIDLNESRLMNAEP